MGLSRKQVNKARQRVETSDYVVTGQLDASTTEEVIRLGMSASEIAFQGSDTLTGNLQFSIDGITYQSSTAIAGSNAIATFNTHIVKFIKVTRTGGEGRVAIAAK